MFDVNSNGNRPRYDGNFPHRRLNLSSDWIGCFARTRVCIFAGDAAHDS
jgi:hypothetical protein